MDLKLHEIQSEKIITVADSYKSEIIKQECDYWVEVKVKERSEIADEFKNLQIDNRFIQHVNEPNESRSRILSKAFAINLPISKSNQLFENDFLTLVVRKNMIITIVDGENDLLDNFIEELNNNPYDMQMHVNYLVYYIISQVIHECSLNIKEARQIVDDLAIEMDERPQELDLEDIIELKRKINQLSNIIEDQHMAMVMIPKMNWSEERHNISEERIKQLEHYNFLHNSINKIEEKIKSLHFQFLLILQEKGNKKLNTLTIIQAIFVPLTLITGIYGMNFIVMPELQWKNGYFLVLLMMLFIAIFELWWFKRKGWFE